VVEVALTQLTNVCSKYEKWMEYRTTFYKAGGVYSIVSAMRHWYNVSDIQEVGCTAIGYVATMNNGFNRQAKEVGAFEVIFCAMQNYFNNCKVQAMGCEALGKLCYYTFLMSAPRLVVDEAGITKTCCHYLRSTGETVLLSCQKLQGLPDGGWATTLYYVCFQLPAMSFRPVGILAQALQPFVLCSRDWP
jgi:hypothetical protein